MQTWKMDELGFVTNNDQAFHARDIKYICKENDDTIVVYVSSVRVAIKFHEAADRDKIYEWFVDAIRTWERLGADAKARYHHLNEDMINIQRDFVKKLSDDGCPHDNPSN